MHPASASLTMCDACRNSELAARKFSEAGAPSFFRDLVETPHSVLTAHPLDERGHPTVQARDLVLDFLRSRLLT